MVKAKTRIKSKEELLEIMNEHLSTQQMFAIKLKAKAELYLDDDDEDKEAKKKRNSYLNSYNAQVDAVSRTSATMIKIFNSSLADDEEDDSSDTLVD